MKSFPLRLIGSALLLASTAAAAPARADEPAPLHTAAPPILGAGAPDAAPPGFRYENKFRAAPIIAGSVTLGLGWATSFGLVTVAGLGNLGGDESSSPSWAPALIPLVGPFVMMGTLPERGRSAGLMTTLGVIGGAQVAGAGLLIAGLAMGRQKTLTPIEQEARIQVLPLVGPAMAGMVLAGTL
ncbi:hypothetical protein [Sorangium sp. So ce1099]|uniref:hypothetical protein n=1 Tax=Sorangium sp. So ce1099 TaxID=3133331 RepID=UPI003F60C367